MENTTVPILNTGTDNADRTQTRQSTVFRRMSTIIAILVLCASVSIAGPAAADNGDDSEPVDMAAEWMGTSLDAGLMHFPDTGNGEFDDYGMSLDVFLALDAADVDADSRSSIIDSVSAQMDEYTSNPDDKDGKSVYAGPTGKALVAAQAAGEDPHNFGRLDVVERMESAVGSNGKIADKTDGDDTANISGQAYAVDGLAEAGSDKAADAGEFLTGQQCDSGAFTQDFDGECDEPNLDSTAMVAIALNDASEAGLDNVDDALEEAVQWLADQQADNGAFGDPDMGENANSTGLAAHALALAGKDESAQKAAQKAAQWIAKLQVTEDTGGKLDGETGAVAYNSDAFDAGKKEGITDEALPQWRGATAQATLGLTHLPPQSEDDSDALPVAAWVAIGVVVVIVVVAGGVLVWRRRVRT